jgi:hypothetical protein
MPGKSSLPCLSPGWTHNPACRNGCCARPGQKLDASPDSGAHEIATQEKKIAKKGAGPIFGFRFAMLGSKLRASLRGLICANNASNTFALNRNKFLQTASGHLDRATQAAFVASMGLAKFELRHPGWIDSCTSASVAIFLLVEARRRRQEKSNN